MGTNRRTLLALLAALALYSIVPSTLAAPKQIFSKNIERTAVVSNDARVSIENLVGQVSIRQGGPQLQVKATVVAGGDDKDAARTLADSIRLDVTQHAGQVLVHVHYPVQDHDSYQYIPTHPVKAHQGGLHFLGMHIGFSNASSDLEYQDSRVAVYQGRDQGVPLHVDLLVNLPAGVHAQVVNQVGLLEASDLRNDLQLKSASGDMTVQGLIGDLGTHSGSGDATILQVQGTLDVHTGSGDIDLNGLQGSVRVLTGSGDITGGQLKGPSSQLHTGSGDIRLDGIAGDIVLDTSSGDIKLNGLAQVKRARINCGSGDIMLDGDLSSMQDFTLRSGSGDITLNSANPPAVHLDIQGSDIEAHWPDMHHVESGRRYLRADIGAASGNGRISTGSGDVTLRP